MVGESEIQTDMRFRDAIMIVITALTCFTGGILASKHGEDSKESYTTYGEILIERQNRTIYPELVVSTVDSSANRRLTAEYRDFSLIGGKVRYFVPFDVELANGCILESSFDGDWYYCINIAEYRYLFELYPIKTISGRLVSDNHKWLVRDYIRKL